MKFKRFLYSILLFCLCVTLAGMLLIRTAAMRESPAAATPAPGGETAATPAPTASGFRLPFTTAEPEPTEPQPIDLGIRISEVMPSNKATLSDGGSFPDWVELFNEGESEQSLQGLCLCCGGERWALPDESLPAGGRLLIFCDGSGSDDRHASFTIKKEGTLLTIETEDGAPEDSFACPAAEGDCSLIRDADGTIVATAFPSPGFENSRAGFVAYQETLRGSGALRIHEAVVYNSGSLLENGSYYDWVEVQNVSDEAVSLSGWYLSDSGSERTRYTFPDRTLEPGELYTVYCTGDDTLTGAAYAPFALDAERDQLFLSAPDGALCDYVSLHDIPYGGSFGRLSGSDGFFYFGAATPGEVNYGGARTVAERPTLIGHDGVFDGVESVTVELSAEGEIHYTLDGSTPDASSPLYTGPIALTGTGVVRAMQLHDGELPSESLDLSFFLNEGHTLPIVSLVSDPANLFGATGLYSNPGIERERPGSVTLYETDGTGFTIECGIKLHGATSKMAQSKKSFKLCFRSRYEGQLHYDLFQNGVTDFSSILLRAAQESTYSTLMRDNIMHQLAIQAFPELPAQDYKYSVLYINGQYWGVYNIREAHSAAHYANHYGYSEESVTQWKEVWDKTGPMGEICTFALNHSLANDDNYNKVAERINVDSVIGWTVMQAYSGNWDIYPPNMRYYYSTEDGMMRYALVDLDLGMFDYNMYDAPLHFGYVYNTLANRLMANKQYQLRMAEQLSAALQGPMSDENVLALIDKLASELRPEMDRDRKRWAHGNAKLDSVEGWEEGPEMLPYLRDFVTRKGGRAWLLMNSFVNHANLTQDEIDQYFGNIVYQKHET